MKISFIIGTRPELIKVAPLIWKAQERGIDFDVVNTAQHKDLLDPYWSTLQIKPSHVLDLMMPGQSLTALTSRAITQIQNYLDQLSNLPEIILAQGDTTTVMAASMVSFYNKIKFAHLEAGLRSFDFENPFPEEYNRKVASISADYHFCPTEVSKNNLLKEGISKTRIHIVGNTVVDALTKISKSDFFSNPNWNNSSLKGLSKFENSVLITCHRRENQGKNLNEIISAIEDLAKNNPQTAFVWTLHPNPNIKHVVLNSKLSAVSNIILVDPLDYLDILKLLKISICAISDSGGIQEEAPSFQTPVLVLRTTTERPEGITAGVAFLVGTDGEQLKARYNYIKNNKVNFDSNPYGDGNSSKRILNILE